jgi:hypothetical protein
MTDPNFAQQAGDFAADAAIDTTVDGALNQGIDAIASRFPGGQGVEQMLNTEVDQVVNNDINAELNKGVDGMLKDAEGLLGWQQQ